MLTYDVGIRKISDLNRTKNVQEFALNVLKKLGPATAMIIVGLTAVAVSAQAPEGRQRGSGEAAAKEDAGIPVPPETSSTTKRS